MKSRTVKEGERHWDEESSTGATALVVEAAEAAIAMEAVGRGVVAEIIECALDSTLPDGTHDFSAALVLLFACRGIPVGEAEKAGFASEVDPIVCCGLVGYLL